MSHCHAEENQHKAGTKDMYLGIVNNKFYSCTGRNSKLNVDQSQSCLTYNAAAYTLTAINSESTRSERMLDQMRPGSFTKTDRSYSDVQEANKRNDDGIDTLKQRSANNIVLRSGKEDPSFDGPLLGNTNSGVLSFPIFSSISDVRNVKKGTDNSKIRSSSNEELWRVSTRFDFETHLMVGGAQSAVKVGESNLPASRGVNSPKPFSGRAEFFNQSLKVGREDLFSNGASSNGGSSSSDSFGGKVSFIRNCGNIGRSTGGSMVKSIPTLGNILGRGIPGSQDKIGGNFNDDKTSINNGYPSTPVACLGICANKNSTELTSYCNGTLDYALAPIASSKGNFAAGIIHGSNIPRGANSTAGDSVNSSSDSLNRATVGNYCRSWNGNVLDQNGSNAYTTRVSRKVDATMGNVLRFGGVNNRSICKRDAKVGAFQDAADSSRNAVESIWLKRALSSTDAEEVKNVGNQLYKRGLFLEALSLYDRAIYLSPSQASFHGNRAAALTGLGRLAEAVQECKEAIKLDPSYGRAHQRVACLYLRLGFVEIAKWHLTEQQADCGDIQRAQIIEKHISRCMEARKVGDWKTVIKESDAAVVAGADSAPRVFGYKAEALLKLGRPEEADAILSAAQRVESSLMNPQVVPSDSFLFVIQVQINTALGRFDSVITAAESAIRVDPHNAEVSALLRKARAIRYARAAGNEFFRGGKFYEACAAYGEGLESDPTNAVLLCNRAACRSKLGQWEKAVEDCSAALNVQPNYTKALMRRANCNAKLERWEDALRDFEILRMEVPGNMEVARGLFDVQVAIKKSRGEEIYRMKFGGEVEVVSSNDQFKEAVTSPGLTVVEFNTRWSDRCREISPFIDQLCKCHPSVNFLKVDVDDNPSLAKIESVSFVPTFKIYKNGLKVKEIIGPSQQTLEFAVKHYSL